MCLASFENGHYLTSAEKTIASQKKQVYFAMKLNLFGRQKESDDDDTNGAPRQPGPTDLPAEVRRQVEVEGHPFGSRLPNNTFNYGGGMRRVKSANGSRPRRAAATASDKNNSPGIPQKTRSHSQEARQSRNALYEVEAPPPSEHLPIPQCKNTLLEIARTKSDQTDLRRMYDYATWNMYDRIVSARNKKRLSEADSAEDVNTEDAAKDASSPSSKHNGKTSPIESSTAATSCSSSTSSPNQAAIACKESGIIKNTSGNDKTAHTIKVQASNFNNTTPSASATNSTRAMSSLSSEEQQQATTTNNATNNSLQNKLRSIHKTFSSQDTENGTAATESTSTESEDSSGSRSGCDSPATFPGFMTTRGSSSRRTMSQGSEDDHFIFQLDM